MKVLHGDSVTDDTEAYQAYMNGEDVMLPDGTVVNSKSRNKDDKENKQRTTDG